MENPEILIVALFQTGKKDPKSGKMPALLDSQPCQSHHLISDHDYNILKIQQIRVTSPSRLG